jgi:hypothetical protein
VADAERIGQAPSLWPALFGLARVLELLGRESEAEESERRAQEMIEDFAESLSEEHRPAFRASIADRHATGSFNS